jgi:hypothetical protein
VENRGGTDPQRIQETHNTEADGWNDKKKENGKILQKKELVIIQQEDGKRKTEVEILKRWKR